MSYNEVNDDAADPLNDEDAPQKPQSGGGNCCLQLVATCCGLFCCGGFIAVIILLIALGPVGWIILGSAVVLFIVLFAAIFCLHQFVIEGTTFHLFNYFLPFLQYGLKSQFQGEPGVKEFWKSMEEEEGSYVAEGIGPNTKTYFGWYEAKAMLASWGDRLANQTMRRHNELGTALMGAGPWPAMQTIALGYTRDDHAVARPFIAGAVDGSRVEDNVPCDGSSSWSHAWLRQQWRDRFDDTDSFSTSATTWWCTKILHKIHLNIDLDDDECQNFINFPGCLSFPGAGKVGVGLGNITDRELCLFKCFTPLPCFNCKYQGHLEKIKQALQDKFPDADWSDERKLDCVGQMFLDSLMYAGGLSVPTILQNMLAWWYSDNRPSDLDRVTAQDEDSIKDFMWETIRRNPPVAGVPRWVSDDDGETWQHEIANVEQAMGDERIFPNPMEFRMGRDGLNARDYRYSMTWADFAIVNNDTCHPDSHVCPGKQLSLDMVVAFWQEFLQCPYETTTTGISVGYNLTTTFTLTRDDL